MTQRDRILVLLEHYRDVCEGVYDRRGADEVLALMCRAWNAPAYQRLEELLRIMHERWPRLRQAIRVRYERYWERRVAWCPGCGGIEPVSRAGDSHVLGYVAGKRLHCRSQGRVATLQPRVVRVLPEDDDPQLVEDAVDWLVARWGKTDPDIPEDVHAIERERALVAARAPFSAPIGKFVSV